MEAWLLHFDLYDFGDTPVILLKYLQKMLVSPKFNSLLISFMDKLVDLRVFWLPVSKYDQSIAIQICPFSFRKVERY
jgi:hypothetical protein